MSYTAAFIKLELPCIFAWWGKACVFKCFTGIVYSRCMLTPEVLVEVLYRATKILPLVFRLPLPRRRLAYKDPGRQEIHCCKPPAKGAVPGAKCTLLNKGVTPGESP